MANTKRLRELIRDGCVAMPGVFNAATARMVERAGFDAVYISGAGLCNATAGVPDVGLLTLTEVALLAGYVARAVKIPCIVDAPLLANMTEFGKSPLMSRAELAELGYRMVIYPQTAFRVSMFATGQMLRDLKSTGTQESWLDRMQTRKELYELLDYDPA